jgi:hypothetical protein
MFSSGGGAMRRPRLPSRDSITTSPYSIEQHGMRVSPRDRPVARMSMPEKRQVYLDTFDSEMAFAPLRHEAAALLQYDIIQTPNYLTRALDVPSFAHRADAPIVSPDHAAYDSNGKLFPPAGHEHLSRSFPSTAPPRMTATFTISNLLR